MFQTIFALKTNDKIEVIDITKKIEEIVRKSKIEDGCCHIFLPHATAGIILNENEKGLMEDYVKWLKEFFPKKEWKHNLIDNNAEAHLMSAFIGQSILIPIKKNKLVRGTWQDILFIEFDGPRSTRKVFVQIHAII